MTAEGDPGADWTADARAALAKPLWQEKGPTPREARLIAACARVLAETTLPLSLEQVLTSVRSDRKKSVKAPAYEE